MQEIALVYVPGCIVATISYGFVGLDSVLGYEGLSVGGAIDNEPYFATKSTPVSHIVPV